MGGVESGFEEMLPRCILKRPIPLCAILFV